MLMIGSVDLREGTEIKALLGISQSLITLFLWVLMALQAVSEQSSLLSTSPFPICRFFLFGLICRHGPPDPS